MAKTNAELDAADSSAESIALAASPIPAPVATKPATLFTDKLYTSRILILPSHRAVPVVAKRVAVLDGDEELLDYLNASAEFQPLQE